MCEFASYIERDSEVLFLTGHQVYDTERGRALAEWSQNIEDDKIGHGAIRWYYGLRPYEGVDHECSDFSTPDNFPLTIVVAIQRGDMRGMGMPLGLLSQSAQAKYGRAEQAARDEYARAIQPTRAEYARVQQAAYAEYARAKPAPYAEYLRAKQVAFWDLFADPRNRAKAWR